jgi:hypothetical protein
MQCLSSFLAAAGENLSLAALYLSQETFKAWVAYSHTVVAPDLQLCFLGVYTVMNICMCAWVIDMRTGTEPINTAQHHKPQGNGIDDRALLTHVTQRQNTITVNITLYQMPTVS